MADILLDEQGFPSTPGSGKMVIYADSSNSQWVQKNDSGIYLGDMSVAKSAQIASHSADTYYLGMQLPSFSMQPGMVFEWYFPVTKTAGTAAPIYTIRVGSLQTTADTNILQMTGPAQTAVADSGFIRVMVTVRTVGVGTGVLTGMVWLQHNLAATGLANTPAGFALTQATAAAFNNTTLAGQYIGLSVNPGASAAWVVEQCLARCWY